MAARIKSGGRRQQQLLRVGGRGGRHAKILKNGYMQTSGKAIAIDSDISINIRVNY